MIRSILFISAMPVLGLIFSQCRERAESQPMAEEVPYSHEEFNAYWYSGKAEVASYDLSQSRYGELHAGKAVLIFVTEPFSRAKQVKLDHPDKAGDDKANVLKLNFTKKFNTGIYPYSMMLSVFSPADPLGTTHALKTTMSSQEWCGHVFTQLNRDDKHYKMASYSYFESEGDEQTKVKAGWLEDEIWNQIRLNYQNLPQGEVEIIPGLFFSRMVHGEMELVKVQASLVENDASFSYLLEFPRQHRTLTIEFGKSFPYLILGWKEVYAGLGGKKLTTTAALDKTLHIDYWAKNKNRHQYLRDSLNLNF